MSSNHRISATIDGDFIVSWTVDRHLKNSRLRHPQTHTRTVDAAGAERFAQRWKIQMPLRLRLVDATNNIHGGWTTVPVGKRTHLLAFRADGRNGAFRIDVIKPRSVWETIDGGKGIATLEEAAAFVQTWIAAAREQATLSPQL